MKRLLIFFSLTACARPTPLPELRLARLALPQTAYDCASREVYAEITLTRSSDGKRIKDQERVNADGNGEFKLAITGLDPGTYSLALSYRDAATGVAVAGCSPGEERFCDNELRVTEFTLIGGNGNNVTIDTPDLRDDDGDEFFNCEELVAGSDPGKRDVPPLSTDNEPPTFTGGLAADAVGATQVRVVWEPAHDRHTPSARLRYIVAWSTTPGVIVTTADYAKCAALPVAPDTMAPCFRDVRSTPGATTLDITNLDPLQSYYIHVKAIDERGNETEALEGEVSAKTLIDNRPAQFRDFAISTSCKTPNGFLEGFPIFDNMADTVSGTVSAESLDRIEITEGDTLRLEFVVVDGETVFCDEPAGTDVALCERARADIPTVKATAGQVRVSIGLAPFSAGANVCGRAVTQPVPNTRCTTPPCPCLNNAQCETEPTRPGCAKVFPACTEETSGMMRRWRCVLQYRPEEADGGSQTGESKTYLVQLLADDDDDGIDVTTSLFQLTVKHKDIPPTASLPPSPLTCGSFGGSVSQSVPEQITFDVYRGVINHIDLRSQIDTDGDRLRFRFGPLPPNVWLDGQADSERSAPAFTSLHVRPAESDGGALLISVVLYEVDRPEVETQLALLLRVRESVSAVADRDIGGVCETDDTDYFSSGVLGSSGLLLAPFVAVDDQPSDAGDTLYVADGPKAGSGDSRLWRVPPSPGTGQPNIAALGVPLYVAQGQRQPFLVASGKLNGDSVADVIFSERVPGGGMQLRMIAGGGPPTAQLLSTLQASGGGAWTTRVFALAVGDVDDDGVLDVIIAGDGGSDRVKLGVLRGTTPNGSGLPTFEASVREVIEWQAVASTFGGLAWEAKGQAAASTLWALRFARDLGTGLPEPYATAQVTVLGYDFLATTGEDYKVSPRVEQQIEGVLPATRVLTFNDSGAADAVNHIAPLGLFDFNHDGADDLYLTSSQSSSAMLHVAFRNLRTGIEPGSNNQLQVVVRPDDSFLPWRTATMALQANRTGWLGTIARSSSGVRWVHRNGVGANDNAFAMRLLIDPRPMTGPADVDLRWSLATDGSDPSFAARSLTPDCPSGCALAPSGVSYANYSSGFEYVGNFLLPIDHNGDGKTTLFGTAGFVGDYTVDQWSTLLYRTDDLACSPKTPRTSATAFGVIGFTGTTYDLADENTGWYLGPGAAEVRSVQVNRSGYDRAPVISLAHRSVNTGAEYLRLSELTIPSTLVPDPTRPLCIAGTSCQPSLLASETLTQPSQQSQPAALSIADLDADGREDLLLQVLQPGQANTSTSAIAVGQGIVGPALSFAPPDVQVSSPARVVKTLALDLDRDARPDLLAVFAGSNVFDMRWYRGQSVSSGELRFDFERTLKVKIDNTQLVASGGIQAPSWPVPMLTGDFDQDGFVDIAFLVHTSAPSARLRLAVLRGCNTSACLGLPFQNDGPDFVVVSSGDMVELPVNDAGGTPLDADFDNAPLQLRQPYLLTSDFNADGRADFVVIYSAPMTVAEDFGFGQGTDMWDGINPRHVKSYVWTLISKPAGGFVTTASRLDNVTWIASPTIVDRNSDGVPDLALSGWHCPDYNSGGQSCISVPGAERRLYFFSYNRR